MLTAVKIKNAKPKDRQYKLADAQGLYLLVRPNGSKLWQYQYQIGNSRKTFSVGAWPDVSLAEARSARMAGRNLVRQGIDPMHKRKVAVEAETGKVTFGEIADEYIERMEAEGRAERTVRKNSWLLKDVGRSIRSTPIEDLKAAEILTLLKKVEATGKLETARRLRTVIGCVFRFAIATLRAENDPTVLLRGSLRNPQVKSHAALTEPVEIGKLMRDIDNYDGWPTISWALTFAALTFQRPGSIRSAKWENVDFETAIWHIPAEDMKGRLGQKQSHDVPLSFQAVVLLNRARKLSGDHRFVFPSMKSMDKILSENAMTVALRRMGYTKDQMTAHGFRSTASTILNERGFRSDVIEAQLAHTETNEVRRAYNRAKYWDERVALMAAWAKILDEFRKLR
ncbi:integrase arm-type DNA-binding domain-containing protein [Nitratireductor aquimarinus]|uniref:tyrosine-type recombinase/integrase n=1 Tax=Nitratireductor aquimarinus TaxID=889300 RepID=UPI001A8E26B0|nr:integrase arm-type DNA-binding domain-containing protein [Nitratireductor aquimarinus]MBN8242430.1 integrase arm-type DNA-binding domain-containing protein [Nitratireductor aquimarinus]MBY6130817.1 integrase arm-type DNA-binding domain-containing protein [Nitratireductor aquimarinus]MCA1302427.1 integrase arm-type DNA-binding domain-containing protein [Nitratireductor aquimarinus]